MLTSGIICLSIIFSLTIKASLTCPATTRP
uniref:Uncharacterized protein n=1 Tax=Arundo donax TaxID=35708 RepID=A0A0A9HLN8_ARUDO